MKGYGAAAGGGSAAAQHAAKRRWKGQGAAVFVLVVFLSMLLPLAFLLGLHNRISAGNLADELTHQDVRYEVYHHATGGEEKKYPSEDHPVTGGEEKKNPSEDTKSISPNEEQYKRIKDINSSPSTLKPKGSPFQAVPRDNMSNLKAPVAENNVAAKEPSHPSNRTAHRAGNHKHSIDLNGYETQRSCELEFGSYCLWSRANRKVMKDSVVKRLKDQLFVARAYYPSIAKLKGQESLTRKLKLNIQDHERMLSEAVSDPDLPPLIEKKMQKMDEAIAKAKACNVDCNNVDRKLRQILDLTEDEAHFHMKQSAFLYQLGVQTMSKTFHCLSMRLTVEYFRSSSGDIKQSFANKIDNPKSQHYVIFSRNILALSVTINSTIVNSEDSGNMVFHVLTDKQNFYSMKQWFVRNSYRKADIRVFNFDEFKLNHSVDLDLEELSMSEEFGISSHSIAQPSSLQMRTKYISVFGHSHFLLSDLFENLKKIIVLDDDVVIQRDIAFLWDLDLGGKVIGAMEFCDVRLSNLKSYLGNSGYDSNSCAWMSGVNVVDLEKWREHDITGKYRRFLHQFHHESEATWRTATLQASMLILYDQICALDNALVLEGLGHDYGVSDDTLKDAAVLHYNGNMKPWLDLGIPKYKKYWKNYLTREERFMDECNVNP
ncbi:putative galacturonosyltransferase 7 isoform X2 [Canna indica]|uniref:Hexosyltransferase n=1 Tax=Canna indica TaxID=4628 RepID=A0AAQ3QNF8_9LILI|nr:putative galacturonosyltransferase 7 isoform X2 [Canna indica]